MESKFFAVRAAPNPSLLQKGITREVTYLFGNALSIKYTKYVNQVSVVFNLAVKYLFFSKTVPKI